MNNFRLSLHQFCVKKSKLDQHEELLSFYEKNVDRNKKRILIACMPKSGSTFFTQLLSHYLHFPYHHLVQSYGRNEQEICWSKLAATASSDALYVHQHVRASEDTLEVIRIFNISTIVLIRNLLDVVVSFRDHIVNESPVFPMAYVDQQFSQWETRRQYEFVIDTILPWYMNFLGTWIEAKELKDVPMLWLNYSDWIHKPEETLERVDRFCGMRHPKESASTALLHARKESIRLNVGISGRGEQFLDDDLKAKVYHLMSYYPSFEPYHEQLTGENIKVC